MVKFQWTERESCPWSGVEAVQFAIVGKGANFGEEASDNLVGEEASAVLKF